MNQYAILNLLQNSAAVVGIGLVMLAGDGLM